MELYTVSAIISLYCELEEQATRFYENLARNLKYSDGKEMFLAFARENKKHKEAMLKIYRESITDAVEAGFSFTDLYENAYRIDVEPKGDLNYHNVLRRAIEIEEKIYKFSIDVSEKSRVLLANFSYAFERIAKRRSERKQILKSLLTK